MEYLGKKIVEHLEYFRIFFSVYMKYLSGRPLWLEPLLEPALEPGLDPLSLGRTPRPLQSSYQI